jgi:pSer/pThr/pTyr-binding forkhead associated (FHA) protein
MPWLSIVTPDGNHRYIPLDDAQTTSLGRARANSVVLADTRCSSFHCVIRRCDTKPGAEPTFVLEDAGSRNGTLHNGEPVEEGDARHLSIGDTIEVGGTTIDVTEAVPADAAPDSIGDSTRRHTRRKRDSRRNRRSASSRRSARVTQAALHRAMTEAMPPGDPAPAMSPPATEAVPPAEAAANDTGEARDAVAPAVDDGGTSPSRRSRIPVAVADAIASAPTRTAAATAVIGLLAFFAGIGVMWAVGAVPLPQPTIPAGVPVHRQPADPTGESAGTVSDAGARRLAQRLTALEARLSAISAREAERRDDLLALITTVRARTDELDAALAGAREDQRAQLEQVSLAMSTLAGKMQESEAAEKITRKCGAN